MKLIDSRFIELFDTLPNIIDSNNKEFKPSYDYGNKTDLINFLKSKKYENENPYPLIWLISPYNFVEKFNNNYESEIEIVVATLSDNVKSNRERSEINIEKIIFPLIENIVKAIERSGFTKLIEKKDSTVYYNYTENDKEFTTDVWDAMKIRLKIEFNNCKINNKINY